MLILLIRQTSKRPNSFLKSLSATKSIGVWIILNETNPKSDPTRSTYQASSDGFYQSRNTYRGYTHLLGGSRRSLSSFYHTGLHRSISCYFHNSHTRQSHSNPCSHCLDHKAFRNRVSWIHKTPDCQTTFSEFGTKIVRPPRVHP